MVYSKKELKEIADFCLKNNIFVISDEVYEKFIYDGKEHVSIASFNNQIKKITAVVNGVSKTYAMTGWRIGYAAAEKEIIEAATHLQDHTTSNACSIAQKAALEALNGSQEDVFKMVKEYHRRRDYMVKKLRLIKGVQVEKPEGAFYVFADVSHYYKGQINGSAKFCQELLEKAYVATVPGVAFGNDHFIRLSYATSFENVKRGLERFQKFCEKLS